MDWKLPYLLTKPGIPHQPSQWANWNSCACFDKAFFCIMPLTQKLWKGKSVWSPVQLWYYLFTRYKSYLHYKYNPELCFSGKTGSMFYWWRSPWDPRNPWLSWKAGPSVRLFTLCLITFPDVTPAKQGRKKITRGISNAQDKQKLWKERVGSVAETHTQKRTAEPSWNKGRNHSLLSRRITALHWGRWAGHVCPLNHYWDLKNLHEARPQIDSHAIYNSLTVWCFAVRKIDHGNDSLKKKKHIYLVLSAE